MARVPSSSPACLQGNLLPSSIFSSSSRIVGSGLSWPSFSWIPSNISALSLTFRDFFFTECPEEWISFLSGWWAWAKSGALWPDVSLSVSWIEVRRVVSSWSLRSWKLPLMSGSEFADQYLKSNLVLQGMSIGTQVKAGWAKIALALLVLAAMPVLGDWTLFFGMEDPFHRIVQMGFLEDSPQLGITLRT